PLRIVCPSRRLVADLTSRLPKWENRGWLGVADAQALRTLINLLRQRCAPTILAEAKGDKDLRLANDAVDMAKDLIRRDEPTHLAIAPNPTFNLSGAKLGALTQAVAYRGIRKARKAADRPRTRLTVENILTHLDRRGTLDVQEATLWRSLRSRDIHRKITDFLWKSIHGTHRIGSFWTHIPGYEERATCTICGVEETMEHILTRCRANGRKEVWALTRALWEKKGQSWRNLKIEDILSAGMGLYPCPNPTKRREPLARLWRTIVPEAAYLIWKLRCERTIGHADEDGWRHTKREITRRWYASVNRRLQLDLLAMNRRFGHLAKNRQTVRATWTGIIGDELGWQDDWTRVPWVLVGIDPGICAVVDPG
ncbi:uncharacterized protein C8Q71DRAFT_703235, partial [Rhodofomes roseus]